MAVTNLAVGGHGRAQSGFGGEVSKLKLTVDLSVTPLAAGNVLRVFNLPAGVVPLGIQSKVTTADSVAAATVDIGVYADDDDAAVDADGLVNELPLGAEGVVAQPPAAVVAITEDSYIGIAQGAAGGGAEFNDAVIELTVAVLDLN